MVVESGGHLLFSSFLKRTTLNNFTFSDQRIMGSGIQGNVSILSETESEQLKALVERTCGNNLDYQACMLRF